MDSYSNGTSDLDASFMRLCLDEARKAVGFTSPNPLVGAVIVKEGHVLAVGHHAQDGGPHAEVEALRQLSDDAARGATLYVNLEPCCHYGRTPPCVDAILRAGISRVVVACEDVDARVAGKGIARLRDAGVIVSTGILEQEARRLNSIFFHYKTHRKPYIVLKAALTLDGKIATFSGDSKWISSEESRQMVHRLRRRLKAVAVGRRTFETDHPRLNCRLPGSENKPVDKIVFSAGKGITQEKVETHFASTPGRAFLFGQNGASTAADFVDFCCEKNIDSVLVEGGGHLFQWFLEHDLADRIVLFFKPAFLGADGISVCAPRGIESIAALRNFNVKEVRLSGGDIMVDLARGEALCLLDW